MRLEFEDHCIKAADLEGSFCNKLDGLRREFTQQKSTKQQVHTEIRNAILADYETIRSDLTIQRRTREEFYEGLINKLGNEIIHLNHQLLEEKKERHDSHESIHRSMKVMRDRFVQLIEVVTPSP